ncbi:nuclear transport factor 2 family protein [Conexibacter stalactiti]|uniref:Nuclear transport factor 2 family protein n=1 Tax=Conexibacter stalactiti TaxID=1940611 RepID=A0ABU4HVQ6_9ACTN|nr:nuclear transport factor 2 family protein [Conexibacter stalactiti]MDW5597356.1 nuclear transport factor 2 family protein [Conexibacter stalactiti]MEC5037998.1 nuclear transport factor 2 family protein [Conexibacter stalactiti]
MSLRELFERYDDAWARRDLDAIVSMHSEEGVFHLHAASEPATGREAVRATFATVMEQYPDLRFERRDVRLGDDFIVFEYVMRVSGVSIDAIDLFVVADGLVTRKDTYLDATVLAALGAAA